MSAPLLLLVSSIYFLVGIQEAMKDNMWWLGFWSCYAGANICWILATKG